MKRTYLLLIIFLMNYLMFSFADAQETTPEEEEPEGIVTDRPDQTESYSLTPKGFFQIETGFVYEWDERDIQNYTYNTTLLKYGIGKNFELRFVAEYIGIRESLEGGEIKVDGFAPITFGTKIRMAEQKGILPAISLIGHLTLANTGKKEFQTPFVAPSFRFVCQNTIFG
jgi:hypothetical protein